MKTRDKPMTKIREVRKRDSRIVPFDETKIADAIYAAFRSLGEGDRSLAVELASAVTHFLEEKFCGTIPGIEDIQDLVETVLIEMGHTKVAKAYILYRQKRAMRRESLQVRKVAGHTGEGISFDYGTAESAGRESAGHPFPEVDLGQDGVSGWQKSKIAAALIREADLDPGVAEDIASNVERKVLDSGWKRISTALVRELVDTELFERGFSSKLQKQAPLGLPKYNLEQIIFGTDSKEGYTFPKTPPEIRNIVANRILHQYSLDEVFTPNVAEAHREGRIFIHRLSDPIRLARLLWRLPAPGAARAGSGTDGLDGAVASYLDLRDFFRKLWHLAHFFSEEIRLSGISNLLLDPASRNLSIPEKVRAVLDRLSQMEERPAMALELDLAPEASPWLEGLLAHSLVHPGRFLLALRLRREILEEPGGEAVLGTIAALYERGERIEFLPRGGRGVVTSADAVSAPGGFTAPSGLERRGAFLSNGAKITINLPRAAFRSARERGSSIETEVEEVLDLAVKGHLERRRFIERLGANRENPLWSLIGNAGGAPLLAPEDVSFSVGLLGLNECVKLLSGEDLHLDAKQDGKASKLGVEIVREIDRKLRREEKSLGIRLTLEETANVGPLRGLERMDRRKYPALVAEIERGRQPQWGAVYTDGVRLHRMAPVDPLRRVEELAPYMRHIDPARGLIEDFAELRSSAKDLLVSLLEECLPMVAS